MNIDIAFYIPELVITLLKLYGLLGITACLLTLIMLIQIGSYKNPDKGELVILFIITFLVWPVAMYWLFEYSKDNRRYIQEQAQRAESYFTYDEPKHLRGGGELDFY
jgi:hypothetical protein